MYMSLQIHLSEFSNTVASVFPGKNEEIQNEHKDDHQA